MADRKRILVADDDPDLLDLLKLDLAYQGYDVSTATNGKEAVDLITSKTFDLVLLDVMMPFIDGYHVAAEVTNRMGAKAPWMIIMTSRDTAREKGIGLLSGAVSMIQKPFTMTELHKKVQEQIQTPR